MNVIRTEVAIVGGGPVGMAMAIELGRRGIACTVVADGDGSVTHGRGGHVNERTIELCRRWGIQEAVTRSGFAEDVPMGTILCTSLRGYEVARAGDFSPAGDRQPTAFSPGYEVRCPQSLLEPILQRRVADFPSVSVLWRHRCESVVQDDTQVEILAVPDDADPAGTTKVVASYLVACDGQSSPIREALRITRSGDPLINYSVSSVVSAPGLADLITIDPALRYTFIAPDGCWGNITSYGDRQRWRLTVLLDKTRPDLSDFDPGQYFRRAAGTDEVEFSVETIRPWRRSELIADTFHDGRVFLAGDAAHTMSPTGGYGLNTGFSDVDNLGWKIDAALRGWAGPLLLGSYTAERRGAAARNAEFANRHFRGWMYGVQCGPVNEDSDEGVRARAWTGQNWLDGIEGEYNAIGGALGYCYDPSPVCLDDGTPRPKDEPGTYQPTSRPGARAPHAWDGDGRSMLDLFGTDFTVMHVPAARQRAESIVAAAARQRVPVQRYEIADDEVARLYQRDLVLVRPDGYVAWRSDLPADTADDAVRIARGHRALPT